MAPPHEPPLPPERWLSTLDDRHPLVRRAAIELLAVHARYASVPSARSLLRKALGDPDASVRRAAMETVWRYHNGERNEIIASIAEHNPDLDLRQTTFDQLVAASHHPDRRLTPTMRDVLLRARYDVLSHDASRSWAGACGPYGWYDTGMTQTAEIRSGRLSPWAMALMVIVPALWLVILYAQSPRAPDFFPLHFAARQVLGGESPYGPQASELLAQSWDAPFAAAGVAYPLPLILLVTPLAPLPFAVAAVCWVVLGAALSAGVTALPEPRGSPLILLLPLCFLPLQRSLQMGQATLIWFGLAVLLLRSVRRGDAWLWAVCIVLLALKPQNGLIFALYGVYMAWRERREVLLIAAALGAALVGLAFVAQPGWLIAWRDQVMVYQTIVRPPTLLPWGLALLLACWRSGTWARLAILQVILFPLSDLYSGAPLLIAWSAFPPPVALAGAGVSWLWLFLGLPNSLLSFWLTLIAPLALAGIWQALRRPQDAPS